MMGRYNNGCAVGQEASGAVAAVEIDEWSFGVL